MQANKYQSIVSNICKLLLLIFWKKENEILTNCYP